MKASIFMIQECAIVPDLSRVCVGDSPGYAFVVMKKIIR